MTKGKSSRGCHLIITGRAIVLILIITIITILICWSLWKRRGRGCETTKASLSSCYTTDTGAYLTHLISERVKVSIHALKLRYDGLEGHTTSRRRMSKRGRNSRSCRINRLHSWLLRSKLGLAPPNRFSADGTHNGEIRRIRNGDEEMAKVPCDSWRKDELITGHRILIDIDDKCDEVKGKVYREVLKKRQKKASTRLCDRVIVRQWNKSKCHHHIKESRTFCKAQAWGVFLPTPYGSQKWDRSLSLDTV